MSIPRPDRAGDLPMDVDDDLHENRRMLLTLMSNLPGMVYRCRNDRRWAMEFVSDGAESLTGHTPSDLVRGGIGYGDLIHPDDREDVWNRVQTAVKDRRPFRFKYRIRCADGHEKLVWEQGRGVYSPEGELLALEGFVTDISDRRELEDQLFQAQKMEAIGQLAGGIAHDFNNLLTVIQGYSDVLLQSVEPESPFRPRIAEIRRAADRAADLTRQLLAFSRRQVLDFRIMDLNAVIRETARMLARLMGAKVRIEMDLAEDLGRIRADAAQIAQVLVNLAVNARDAMPGGGTLRFRTATVADSSGRGSAAPKVLLAISDTGEGIPPGLLGRIFEPFFTTKAVGRGTGLGLSTVYGIVKQSGGTVEVESTLGRGTTFSIVLPAAKAEGTDREEVEAGRDRPSSRGGRILIVEDDPGVRDLVAAVLTEAGYSLIVAEDGPRAIACYRAAAGRIRLVLTDLKMPSMDGRVLAAALRADDPDLRVLYMSGFAEKIQETIGADELLPKPFSPAELLAAIRRICPGLPSRRSDLA